MMMSKGAALILLLMLGSMNVILANIKPVKAMNSAIVIKPDGSIAGTDKIQRNGDFYYLTGNIEISSPRFGDSGISIQRDNIVIDGKNFSITEKNDTSSIGVDMTGRFNVTIQNLKITRFSTGIIFGSFSDMLGKEEPSSNNTIIGNTITGFWIGIWISASSSGNKIIDNKITAGDEGIVLYYSDNNYLSGNFITGNRVGLSIEGAENNVLRNNRMYDNELNFEILHVSSSSIVQDIDTSNTVNNKPIYYWINQHNKTIPSDAGFVALGNCSGITVQNLNIKNNGVGVLLYSTRDSVITNNHLENNGAGIFIIISQGINIIENNVIGNKESIRIHGSSDIIISKNSIMNSRSGIELGASKNVSILINSIARSTLVTVWIRGGERNVVSGNNFTDNDVWCVYLLDTNHNIIVVNSFTENNGFAIRWSNSYNNTFYHNNFINNSRGYKAGLQVSNPWFFGSGDHEYNTWDNGYEGNYWSDYISRYSNATEVNDSGIWDVPFFINEVNIDRFPLTEPVDIELATIRLFQPPDICISSPENITYTANCISLNFTVNEATSWMGYSLDGQNNVTLTETTLELPELSEGSHSLTVYANDTAGDMGTSETIYFIIGKSLITWVIGAIVIVAVVGAAFLVYFLKIKKATNLNNIP
jgi:parallel beta-helix repeat protein